MHRYFSTLAVLALLVGCAGQGGGTADGPSAVSPTTGAPGSPGATDDPAGAASAECSDAFVDIAETSPTSITELGGMEDAVEPTLESCESVAEWLDAAGQVIEEEINPNTAELLLRMNCESPSVANTPICREL